MPGHGHFSEAPLVSTAQARRRDLVLCCLPGAPAPALPLPGVPLPIGPLLPVPTASHGRGHSSSSQRHTAGPGRGDRARLG